MQLQKIVRQENQKCWGKPLGSQSLWNGHVQTIKRIQDMASHVTIDEVSLTLNFFFLPAQFSLSKTLFKLQTTIILIDYADV